MIKELYVDIEHMADMAAHDKDAFTLNRKNGFGASDSSIILKVNKWSTIDDLILEKNTPAITDKEREVGQKPNVRMGADLEPVILDKFTEMTGLECHKPDAQYRFKDFPWLTVNYDGAIGTDIQVDQHITCPVGVAVEAKCVSQFARKFWGWDKGLTGNIQLTDFIKKPYEYEGGSMTDRISTLANMYGIPPYYFTQVQQQMIGTAQPYCYLIAMDVKEWTPYVFKIYEDRTVQETLIALSAEYALKCPHMPQP